MVKLLNVDLGSYYLRLSICKVWPLLSKTTAENVEDF